jgi:hypothetical protein
METFRADTGYKDVEHYSDKLLIVCAEGTVGFGDRSKPVGLLDEAVVVAATGGEARELWSQFGQDTDGMFDGLMPPPAGGAWVFEGCISWDERNEENIIRGRWRRPTELEARWLCRLDGESTPNYFSGER